MRALSSLLGGIAIAVIALALPVKAFAADVPFFYGPVLNCTGYFTIQANVTDPGASSTRAIQYTPVTPDAIPNNPNSSDGGAGGTLPSCVSLCDVFVLFNNLVKLAISSVITIVIPIMLVISGFSYMLSGANPGRRAGAQKMLTATLVGLVIIICSALIVSQIMTLAFQNTWGDQLRSQAASTGVDVSKVPDFTWNSLSCSPVKGGVSVTPTTVPPRSSTTPSTNTPASSTVPASTGSGCVSSSTKQAFNCPAGWKSGRPCAAGQWSCAAQAGHVCIATCRSVGRAWSGMTQTINGTENCACSATR